MSPDDQPRSVAPALIQFRAGVVDVTVRLGRVTIALVDVEGDLGEIDAAAKASDVDTAFRFHREGTAVVARVFDVAGAYRLLSLRDARVTPRVTTPQERKDYITSRWSGLLHHLTE